METSKITSKNVSLDSSLLMEMVHAKNKTEAEKTKFVTEQFESVLVKQFLNDALKPMFKGVFNENSEGHSSIVTFSQMHSQRVSPRVVVLEFLPFYNNNFPSQIQ